MRPEQAEAFYQRLCACRNVAQPVNIMSHFSRADEPESDATLKQIACFEQFARGKPGQRSVAASGGTLLWPDAHNEWVRPGIILYGVSPLDNGSGAEHGLQPAMTLKSSLIAVREHKAGEAVGYGGTWVSPRDTRLGVVAMGYGDGYPRSAPTGTPILINGREVPIVGRVSMDMISVDLGPDAVDKVGMKRCCGAGAAGRAHRRLHRHQRLRADHQAHAARGDGIYRRLIRRRGRRASAPFLSGLLFTANHLSIIL